RIGFIGLRLQQLCAPAVPTAPRAVVLRAFELARAGRRRRRPGLGRRGGAAVFGSAGVDRKGGRGLPAFRIAPGRGRWATGGAATEWYVVGPAYRKVVAIETAP